MVDAILSACASERAAPLVRARQGQVADQISIASLLVACMPPIETATRLVADACRSERDSHQRMIHPHRTRAGRARGGGGGGENYRIGEARQRLPRIPRGAALAFGAGPEAGVPGRGGVSGQVIK